ncbi:MAG TPA: hypothetical protein VNS58_16475 [Puia sp.]|nr:hypothetical protein [Puia sp.]
MRKTTAPFLLLLPAIPFLFGGCIYSSHFQSPFYGTSEPYHTIPLKSDSVPSATYVSGVFTEGGANDGLRDNVFSFTGSIYRSHNFGHFQGFYGGNVSLGSYNVGHYSYYNDARPRSLSDSLPVNARAGDIINGKGQYKGFDSTYESEPFFQQSLSFTHDRFTGSFQLNVGIHVTSAQLGVGYRLGRNQRRGR